MCFILNNKTQMLPKNYQKCPKIHKLLLRSKYVKNNLEAKDVQPVNPNVVGKSSKTSSKYVKPVLL